MSRSALASCFPAVATRLRRRAARTPGTCCSRQAGASATSGGTRPPTTRSRSTARWPGSASSWRPPTAGVAGPVLVVGKSLGTYGAPARRRALLPGDLADAGPDRAGPGGDAIRANPARQLLVGGTDDPLWDADVAASLAARRVRRTAARRPRPRPDRPRPTRSAPPRPWSRSPAPWCGSWSVRAIPGSPGIAQGFQGQTSAQEAERLPWTRLSAGARPASRRRCWRGRSRGPRSRPARRRP